jgi:putative surface-exposed virulence protein
MRKLIRLFSASLILAVALSAAFTIVASADDSTPPTDPTPTDQAAPTEAATTDSGGEATPTPDDGSGSVTSTEEPAPTEATATEEPTADPTLDQTAADATVVDESSNQEPATSEQTMEIADVISELPEDTELVVLDESGEQLSLASGEAADALSTSDPIWCPSSIAVPVAGPNGWVGGCSPSFFSIRDLITWLTTNDPNVAGTIWLEKTFDSGSVEGGATLQDNAVTQLTLNGASFANLDLFALTIKGGWNGLGFGTIDTTDPSEINQRFWIIDWQANVTLNDILITGASSDEALAVDTTKNIVLNRVSVQSNSVGGANYGAYLDNTAGTGTVTVSNSTFNLNTGRGLYIVSNGNITLSSVTANSNVNGGALLDNDTGIGTVSISNSTFSNNTSGGKGLEIFSKGTITLNSVTANTNVNGGALLDNSSGTGAVTVTSSTFSTNTSSNAGLEINSKGTITLSSVTASTNIGLGADLDNCLFVFACTATGSVVITNGTFSDNDGGGLLVSSGGAITLTNVKADLNGTGSSGYGANLDNSSATSAKNVTVTATLGNWNEFNTNRSYGLQITSKGLVSVKDVTASGNGAGGSNGSGLLINNTWGTLGVTFTGTNVFNDNLDDGLWIASKGAISLNNIIANSNGTGSGDYGAELDNTYASPSTPGVTLNGTNQFKFNYDDNLYIQSNGLVTINNVTANSSNTGMGVNVYNIGTGTAGVTLTGTNVFLDNDDNGLYIATKGTITLSNITANYNGIGSTGNGAYLSNTGSTLYSGVTLSGVNTFNGNQTIGLEIDSTGPITLNSVTASDNIDSYGIKINNTWAAIPAAKSVTLNGTNVANGNKYSGLYITASGAITLNNLTVTLNGSTTGSYGVYLDNCSWSSVVTEECTIATPQAVTITNSTFNENGGAGLWVIANGPIKLTTVTANENGFGSGASQRYGIRLDNCYQYLTGGIYVCGIAGTQAVTLTTVKANDNFETGIWVTSSGAITGSSLNATGNGFGSGASNRDGARLDNCYSWWNVDHYECSVSGNPLVNISGTSVFSENKLTGLVVESRGSITLSNITSNDSASGFSGNGAALNNDWLGMEAGLYGISLTGINSFSRNGSYGLSIESYGIVSLASVTANDNLSYGVSVDNCGGTYEVNPGPPIVRACRATTSKAVNLTGTNNFVNNSTGLYIVSRGPVNANSVTASDNTGDGAYIDNCFSFDDDPTVVNHYVCTVAGQSVKFTGTNVFKNNYYGVELYSGGLVSFNNVTATDNAATGLYADNCQIDYDDYLCNLTGNNTFTLTGVSNLSSNDGHGLAVYSNGLISVNSLTANENGFGGFGYGVNIENYMSNLITIPGVTFTGTNKFDGNKNGGLSVVSKGVVSLNNVTATNSPNGFGVAINNSYSGTIAPKDVKITGTNNFSGNNGTGLQVASLGTISLNNVTANNNLGGSSKGAYLDNCYFTDIDPGVPVVLGCAGTKGVVLTGTNVFNGNGNHGLYIWTPGLVSSSLSLTASDNLGSGYGVYIGNNTINSAGIYYGVSLLAKVTLLDNAAPGMEIYTRGNVALANVTANGNGISSGYGSGVYVDSCTWDGGLGACLGTGNVTLTGVNTFNGNDDIGLNIYAGGTFTSSAITANDNGTGGAFISNSSVQAKTVILNGTNIFTGNDNTGLYIVSAGAVTVNSVTSGYNGNGSSGDGVYIQNTGATLEPGVTLTGTSKFIDNDDYGLDIITKGAITLNNITASLNDNGGAVLQNNFGVTNDVKLTGVNEFSYNTGSYGLYILTNGAVTLDKILADGNANSGLYITGATNVTLTCGDFSGNGGSGYNINYSGLLTLKGVFSAGNSTTDVSNDSFDDLIYSGFPDRVTVRTC